MVFEHSPLLGLIQAVELIEKCDGNIEKVKSELLSGQATSIESKDHLRIPDRKRSASFSLPTTNDDSLDSDYYYDNLNQQYNMSQNDSYQYQSSPFNPYFQSSPMYRQQSYYGGYESRYGDGRRLSHSHEVISGYGGSLNSEYSGLGRYGSSIINDENTNSNNYGGDQSVNTTNFYNGKSNGGGDNEAAGFGKYGLSRAYQPKSTNNVLRHDSNESFNDMECDDINQMMNVSGMKNESNGTNKKKRAHKSKTTHNVVEKKRRAHLKTCYTTLKSSIPSLDGQKLSTVNIIQEAQAFIIDLEKKTKNNDLIIDGLRKQRDQWLGQLLLLSQQGVNIEIPSELLFYKNVNNNTPRGQLNSKEMNMQINSDLLKYVGLGGNDNNNNNNANTLNIASVSKTSGTSKFQASPSPICNARNGRGFNYSHKSQQQQQQYNQYAHYDNSVQIAANNENILPDASRNADTNTTTTSSNSSTPTNNSDSYNSGSASPENNYQSQSRMLPPSVVVIAKSGNGTCFSDPNLVSHMQEMKM